VKLGLGSSAALTVALTSALLRHLNRAPPGREQLLDLATRAHRRFQGGTGSGLDVATAVCGGVVALVGGEVRSLTWPAGLAWLAVWSGASASTEGMLARYEAFRRRDPARFARHTAGLREIATAAVSAWERADIQPLLRSLADYDDALRALDGGAGLGIYTPEHERLARVAQQFGAVYKISGAGGGDFGVALADSAEVIDRLTAALTAERALVLPATQGAAGVTL
jgi:phosphomevalonate kinase